MAHCPSKMDPSILPMTTYHRRILLRNHFKIKKGLVNSDKVIDFLIAKQCFDEDTAKDIMAGKRTLLAVIRNSADSAFQCFAEALDKTQHTSELFSLLHEKSMLSGKRKMFIQGAARCYYRKLCDFNMRNIVSLNSKADGYSPRNDILLKHSKEMQSELPTHRKGFSENVIFQSELYYKTTSHQPPDLFKLGGQKVTSRSILIVGAQGVGKTFMLFNLLDEISKRKLWTDDFWFTVFVPFKDIISLKKPLSFQDLLFYCCGPMSVIPHFDQAEAWDYITHHQDRILFLIDGYEDANTEAEQVITCPTEAASINVLIINLIRGHILPYSRLLITSCVQSVHSLKNDVQCILEHAGLNTDALQKLIEKRLEGKPKLASSVFDCIRSQSNILSLCSSPVLAIGLLDYITLQTRDEPDQDIVMEELPRSRAHMMLLLIANILNRHDQTLNAKSPRDCLHNSADILEKLCKLAGSGVARNIVKHTFNRNDLQKVDLTEDEVIGCGLMVQHKIFLAEPSMNAQNMNVKFPHRLFQAILQAIYLTLGDKEQMNDIIRQNDSSDDMVIQMILGLYGDPKCRDLLHGLCPMISPDNCGEIVEKLLEAIIASPRRSYSDGEMFIITSLAESLQTQQSRIVNCLVSPLYSLNLNETDITIGNFNSLLQFMNHIPKERAFKTVYAFLDVDAEGILPIFNAGGFTGIILGLDHSPEKLRAVSDSINSSSTLEYIGLYAKEDKPLRSSAWNEICITENTSLRCIALTDMMIASKQAMQRVCDNLQLVHNLCVLDLSFNDLSSKDGESLLKLLLDLTGVQYLVLSECHIGADDMDTVAELITTVPLQYLNLDDNCLNEASVSTLAKALITSACQLVVLSMAYCEITSNGAGAIIERIQDYQTLRCLHLGANELEACPNIETLLSGDMRELDISYCELPRDSLRRVLCTLCSNIHLKWLDISQHQMSSDIITHLCNVFQLNHNLQALCLGKCELTDGHVLLLIPAIKQNTSLKLLDLDMNACLTSDSLTELIVTTRVQHLNVKQCDLDYRDLLSIASALVHNSYIVTFMVGDNDKERELVGFMQNMRLYPSTGPLAHLLVYGERQTLASEVCTLEKQLPQHTCLSFVSGHSPFLILSGLFLSHIPNEKKDWLLDGSTSIR